ncbi:MAG: hypothetical protein FD123_3692 [Bacteroidetes bacterium]|nr:MAG: hypothetical protein FD123_3692 [Bacteroidota bacterium]
MSHPVKKTIVKTLILSAMSIFVLFGLLPVQDSAAFFARHNYFSGTDTLPGISIRMRGTDTIFFITKNNTLHAYRIYPPMNELYKTAGQPMPAGWEKMAISSFITAAKERNYSYSQMCSKPKQKTHTEFTYGGIPWQHDHLKAPGFEILRKRRENVIAYYAGGELLRRVRYLDDLNILIDLNVVDMLPAMLEYEKKLKNLILAGIDGKVMFDTAFTRASGSEMHYLTQSYVHMLSAMIMLLRQENYAPLLNSDMEKTFREKLLVSSKDTLVPDVKSREIVFNDPVYKVTRSSSFRTSVPVNAANLDLIEKWVEDYCKNVLSEAKKTAAKRMTPWPVAR